MNCENAVSGMLIRKRRFDILSCKGESDSNREWKSNREWNHQLFEGMNGLIAPATLLIGIV